MMCNERGLLSFLALALCLGAGPLLASEAEAPPLPGTPDYIRQETKEILELARCSGLREKAALYAAFASRRIRELEAIRGTADAEFLPGLADAHRLLWEKGALVCLRLGTEKGLDMRDALETALGHADRQHARLQDLRADPDGEPPLRESARLVARLREELRLSLEGERERMAEKIARFRSDATRVAARVREHLAIEPDEANRFLRDVLPLLRDDNDLHEEALIRAARTLRAADLDLRRRAAVRFLAAVHHAADNGLALEHQDEVQKACGDAGPEKAADLFETLAAVLEDEPGETARTTSRIASRLAARLMAENYPAEEVRRTLETFRYARESGLEMEEIDGRFRRALQETSTPSLNEEERVRKRVEALSRARERLMNQIRGGNGGREDARTKLEKLRERLERERARLEEEQENKGKGKGLDK